ncbi:unnamed protein product [Symbiodinium natans]|uniref:OmpA-like domain-containing protein n=1 Tax=Symbiodinium natans TaxID=878477 RepID=A0A812UY49_9DINO|nr:unnamed protein product [Symbiodinium natans]
MAASSPKTAGQSNFTIQLHCVRLRDHFETEGVCHSIRCIGCGSAEGLGLRVRVRLEAGRFSGCLALISSTVICGGFLQELESAPTRAPPTPASPTQETDRVSKEAEAKLVRSYPELVIQCSGFAEGLPEEDSQAKRQLSQLRADSIAKMLRKHGVKNKILSYGFGSALGSGLSASMASLDFLAPDTDTMSDTVHAEEEEFRLIPNPGISEEHEGSVLDALLKELLSKYTFEPNSARNPESSAASMLRMVSVVLKSFPSWTVRCEGHAKGLPKDNNPEKKQLSLARAENFRRALQDLGVRSPIQCFGYGSEMGIGKAVRMYALGREGAFHIADLAGMSGDERARELDRLLDLALTSSSIDFVPNQTAIPKSAAGVLSTIAELLGAVPEDMMLVCEAHARGLPEENTDSKQKLTKRRAELWCQELRARGVTQTLQCRGAGCGQGLGPCIRMWVTQAVKVPDTETPIDQQAQEDPRARINAQLAAALDKDGAVKFATNSYQARGESKELWVLYSQC